MLKVLIKKQLLEMWQSYFVNKKTGKAKSSKGTILSFALLGILFVGLGFAFYAMAGGLGVAMLGQGFNWLYFALMGLLSMALGVFGSVFNTYASVYLPKDNAFLTSLPIPNRTLLLSRLAGVFLTSLMYSAWIWIPVMIAYWVKVPVNALNVIFPVLMTFVIAGFVSVLSCILGWVVALIAAKAKGRSFVTLFLSLAVMALYYVVYFKIVGSMGEIMEHIAEIGSAIESRLHYAYLLGRASDGDAISMLLVMAITLALAVVCFLVLLKTFPKLSSVSADGRNKAKLPTDYRKREVKAALLHREYKHFTSLSTWMLNGGFGLLLMPVGAAALLIKRGAIMELLPEIAAEMPALYNALLPLLASAICLALSTSVILPVSVSIEGKSLWLLQSLPLEPFEVLHAKEKMAVSLSIYPATLLTFVCGVVFQLAWWETGLMCLAVWLYVWLSSDFGLFLNLKMPNFNWTNVAYLTKQSLPVMIDLFGGWAFCAALGVGGYFLTKILEPWAVLCAFGILFLTLWLGLHRWLKTKGARIFANL